MSEPFSGTSRSSRSLYATAAAPPVALALTALLLATGLPGVRSAFWHVEPVNVAEAAALRDLARVRLLVEEGADPNARLLVRAGILGSEPREMTPLEAARETGASGTIDLLLELGGR